MAHPSHLALVFAVLSAPTVVGAEIEQDATKIIIRAAPILEGGVFLSAAFPCKWNPSEKTNSSSSISSLRFMMRVVAIWRPPGWQMGSAH